MVSQSSSGTSWAGLVSSARPALLISTSIWRQDCGSIDSASSIEALSVTSICDRQGRLAQFGGQRIEAVLAARRQHHLVAVA